MSHQFRQGSSPLLVSFPHNGSHISADVATNMTAEGRSSLDTDWFLDRLYDFPELRDASLLVAEQSRYVIDLNRPRTDESLYPGQTTTGLIPLNRFDGKAIYEVQPSDLEVQRRIDEVWIGYHRQIKSEMHRLVRQHGVAVLIEAHSIESEVPRLFDGKLSDFNIGSNRGESCDVGLTDAVMRVIESQEQYSSVLNGRFVGGYITRHFGDPANHCHAIQFELSQATYLNESTKQWDDEKALQVQPVFRNIITGIKQWLNTK